MPSSYNSTNSRNKREKSLTKREIATHYYDKNQTNGRKPKASNSFAKADGFNKSQNNESNDSNDFFNADCAESNKNFEIMMNAKPKLDLFNTTENYTFLNNLKSNNRLKEKNNRDEDAGYNIECFKSQADMNRKKQKTGLLKKSNDGNTKSQNINYFKKHDMSSFIGTRKISHHETCANIIISEAVLISPNKSNEAILLDNADLGNGQNNNCNSRNGTKSQSVLQAGVGNNGLSESNYKSNINNNPSITKSKKSVKNAEYIISNLVSSMANSLRSLSQKNQQVNTNVKEKDTIQQQIHSELKVKISVVILKQGIQKDKENTQKILKQKSYHTRTESIEQGLSPEFQQKNVKMQKGVIMLKKNDSIKKFPESKSSKKLFSSTHNGFSYQTSLDQKQQNLQSMKKDSFKKDIRRLNPFLTNQNLEATSIDPFQVSFL